MSSKLRISRKHLGVERKLCVLLIFIPMLLFGCSNTLESDVNNKYLLDYNALQDLYRSVIEKVNPSIVAISTQNSYDVGFGTGVIVDASGLILTSEHVVSNAKKISILLSNQRIFEAKTISADE
ncbi:MAG: S1C family serine protease, partial [Planctomycetes bacterium]|nr:S1C family serine protease [Planctomycetota bacterium]